jgi:hypothetical protein
MQYRIEGKDIFRFPINSKQPELRFAREALERQLRDLMDRYGIRKLEANIDDLVREDI